MLYLLHVKLPTLHHSLLLSLRTTSVKQIAAEVVNQSRDIFIEGVVGLQIFVQAVDEQTGQSGLFVGVIYDRSAQFEVVADAGDYLFDEVVAVVEALVFEQLCSWVVHFDAELMVGTDQLLDLSFEFYFLLLFLLDKQELFLELSLQLCQQVPRVISTLHIINTDKRDIPLNTTRGTISHISL